MVLHAAYADLLQLVEALGAAGGLARGLDGGEQQGHQHADNGDDDEKLNQGERIGGNEMGVSWRGSAIRGEPPSAADLGAGRAGREDADVYFDGNWAANCSGDNSSLAPRTCTANRLPSTPVCS